MRKPQVASGCGLYRFGPGNAAVLSEATVLDLKTDRRPAFAADIDVVERRDADRIESIVDHECARDRDRFDRLIQRSRADDLDADDALLTKDPGDRTCDCVGTRL